MLWDSRGFSVLFVGEKATESVCSYDFYRESLKESLESMGTDAFRAGRRFGAEGPAGRKSQEKGGMKNSSSSSSSSKNNSNSNNNNKKQKKNKRRSKPSERGGGGRKRRGGRKRKRVAPASSLERRADATEARRLRPRSQQKPVAKIDNKQTRTRYTADESGRRNRSGQPQAALMASRASRRESPASSDRASGEILPRFSRILPRHDSSSGASVRSRDQSVLRIL